MPNTHTRLRSMAEAIRSDLLPALPRGTVRNPGADLARLPVGLDLRAISVAEGIRAALACATIILIETWVDWPPLVYMALAANLACFSDAGGPLRPRLAALVAFTVLGALIWCTFGLLRPTGLTVVVPVACLVIFCTSFARVWGTSALAVGNVLTVALAFALDRPLDVGEAAVVGAMFIAGGAWATVLALFIWRLDPYTPARASVAEVWRLLAVLTRDLSALLRRDYVSPTDWESHARAHRRAVREAIEQARIVVGDLARLRGSLSSRSARALLRLEAGDQLFGALIALSDLLEEDTSPARRAAGRKLVRLLAPMLDVLARSMLSDSADHPRRAERAMATALSRTASDPAVHHIAETIVDRLRIVLKLEGPDGGASADVVAGEPPESWRERVIGPIRANMTWESAILRHALRAAIVAGPALAITLIWQGAFTHWLTITVVLTMQPYFAATWQRALERIGGTVLGGLVGALLVHAASTPLALAALMFPLCILGFSARQVSYGAFIACLMPQLVVLVELIQPGYSSWDIVEVRALFTVIGGMIAVAGCLLLWPSWEKRRLRRDLRAALAAHGCYADAVFAAALGEVTARSVDTDRRRAGIAVNNLEASISRALQEPRHSRQARQQLDALMVADAALRRLGGRLAVLQHDSSSRRVPDRESWLRWRSWIAAAFAALAEGGTRPARGPDETGIESLSRIGRQIELLGGALDCIDRTGERHQSADAKPAEPLAG